MTQPGERGDGPPPLAPAPTPAIAPAPAPPLPLLNAPPLPMPPLSPRPRVEITFEYTYDELHEGLTHTPPVLKQPKKPPPFVRLVWWMTMIAVTLYAMWYANIGRFRAPPPAPAAQAARLVDGAMAVLPAATGAAAFMLLIIVLAATSFMLASGSARVRHAQRFVPIIGVYLLVALFWAGGLLTSSLSTQGKWIIKRESAMWLAFTPSVAAIVLAVVVLAWADRSGVRQLWNTRPTLRRRATVVLADEGLRAADEMMEQLYRWPCFLRAWETGRTLVLLDENDLRHILPKRVMDRTSLDQARSIISNHIPETHFLTTPGGFPVAPPGAPAPAPAPDPARAAASQPQ